MKSSTLEIKTPEGIVFSQPLAGPVTRFLAWMVDLLCISVLLLIVRFATGALMLLSVDIAAALNVFMYFVVSIGYGIVLEWFWRGQTFGKRLVRIRVVDAQGLKLRFNQIAIRNLLRVVDLLPGFYLVGGVTCLFTVKAQRLGDVAANTVVVRIPRLIEPDMDQLASDKFNSLRGYAHLQARLRQRVSPGEAAVALQAIVRRDEFDPAARVRLFSELAKYFKAKVEFPSEAIEGITDEQYLRNIVDVLYRTDRSRCAPRSRNSRTYDERMA